MSRLSKLTAGFAVFILLLLHSFTPIFASHLPALSGYVNDFAEVLTSEQKATLEQDLITYEQQTGNEIAIALVKNLDGQDIDDFTVRVFEEWKIGKADNDNGILFLAAIEDRKMRIEVGYGLEPYLTDSEAGSIIRDIIAPEFREGNYFTGILKAIESIKKQMGTSAEEVQTGKSENAFWPELIAEIGIPLLFIVVLYLFAYMSRTKSIWLGGVVGGATGTVVGFIAASLLVTLVAALTLGILGTILDYILSAVYQKRKAVGKPTDWWSSGGGFFTGGSRGSGFGGFGGGNSGGGGSSGGW